MRQTGAHDKEKTTGPNAKKLEKENRSLGGDRLDGSSHDGCHQVSSSHPVQTMIPMSRMAGAGYSPCLKEQKCEMQQVQGCPRVDAQWGAVHQTLPCSTRELHGVSRQVMKGWW